MKVWPASEPVNRASVWQTGPSGSLFAAPLRSPDLTAVKAFRGGIGPLYTMSQDRLALAVQNVPRYTSYPTAPHFSSAVDSAVAAEWLTSLPERATLSLYLHVPFCRVLCHYCGCHTRAVRRDAPVVAYAETLESEIGLVRGLLGGGRPVTHIHWGGGTPSILPERSFCALVERIGRDFDPGEDAEHAIELDPRTVTPELARRLSRAGINRVSLGVQDFNPAVQVAVGRWQPAEVVEGAVAALREAGLTRIGFDLMYGLPRQGTADVERTVERTLGLRPGRIAAFGYAHVPWFKKNQQCIDTSALPNTEARIVQATAIDRLLTASGYVRIGLDHYALPDDELAEAARAGTLRRNFQGYTTDPAEALIGLGASAIGRLPQGFVQNAPDVGGWRRAVVQGRPATVRGLALRDDDKLRGDVIERLMCNLAVDLNDVCASHGRTAAALGGWRAELGPLEAAGLVTVEGARLAIPEDARDYVRLVAAVFDAYRAESEARHARAV